MFGFEFQGGAETRRLNQIVAAGRASLSAKDIEHVKESVREMRAVRDYESHCEYVRRAYLGDQEARIKQVLAGRYPRSHHLMPIVPVGVVSETAEIEASVYTKAPTRHVTKGGVPLADDDARQAALTDVIEKSALDIAMHEAEKVACSVETAMIRHAWTKRADVYGRQRMLHRGFWPHTVWAVTSKESPERIGSSSILIAKIHGGAVTADGDVHEVWMRSPDGVITYQHVDGKGRELVPLTVYEGVDLPWTCLHVRPTQGELYAAPDRDLMSTQDQINASMCDGWYRQSLQSHKQLFGSGIPKGTQIAYGPDVIMTSDQPGATMTALDMQADSQWHDLLERHLVLHGRSRGQPVDAWWTKGGNPETATALAIRNRGSEQRRKENEAIFADEESVMLRIIARIADTFGNLSTTIDGPDVDYLAVFPDRKQELEEPVAKTSRVVSAFSAGIIDRNEARVALGFDVAVDEKDDSTDEPADDVDGGISDETTAEQDKNVATTLNELSLAIERIVRAGDLALLNATRRAYALALGAPEPADLTEIPAPPGSEGDGGKGMPVPPA